ncbi:methyl-accepting chemotaxis protein [Shewanella intestini]|uniref:Methyl-accepting chemotaxis protein n=1 Tax=Shewanella intestini TaxID=2017544 RepID=A0ABS5I170_9GAMM|nr:MULTISPECIES: methyl-accepting chemotaxis protein [Shewanella]MBR9727070.1 methyl-accepting chemotaxis protein [Shewanella intestini]MRG35872.1 methyl-accepting chemotaxis protein [Shewanella sp. XMDDZSB0408]
MKEVKFRWVDQFLIHMSLKTKFTILAIVPMLMMIGLTVFLNHQHQKNVQQTYLNSVLQSNNATINYLDSALKSIPDNQRQSMATTLSSHSRIQQLNALPFDLKNLANAGGGIDMSKSTVSVISKRNNHNQVIVSEVNLSDIDVGNTGFSYALVAALLFILFIFAYYISTFVGGALFTSVKALRQAADGDLTGRLKFFEVRDEFSILAISIDKLVERQHHLVKNITQATEQIRNVVSTFRNNAEEGQALAINQRQHLDSLAAAMEEMTAAVHEVANNAEQSSTETQEVNNQVATGSKDIQTTVNAIDVLSTEIGDASNAVVELNDNANKIDDIVTTINAISEQTNLLALNAAIEAARAGEQGRGFAVVADEVRTLAGRTQSATVEIKTMIEALQSGTRNLTQVMSRTVEQAEEGKKHVLHTGEDLTNIAQRSTKAFDMSVLIATSAEQQSGVANDIASNLTEIKNQSQDVELSATGAVAGCEELFETAEQLDKLLVGLKV